LLYWTDNNREQVESLFRQSGLYRSDKWEREDYRNKTLDKAFRTTRNENRPTKPEGYLTVEELEIAKSYKSLVTEFVEYAAERTDASITFLEATGYAILTGVVGRKAMLNLTTGKVVPSLWFQLIGESGISRKTTTIRFGQDILEAVDPSVIAPTDFSPEAFIDVMAARDGKPTIFIRDEFAEFYDALNNRQYQAGGKENLIRMYDGRSVRRKLRNDEFIIREPFLSILSATTESRFLATGKKDDVLSGFLARFALVVPGERRTRKPVELADESIIEKSVVFAVIVYS
jgi:hypothetical protein